MPILGLDLTDVRLHYRLSGNGPALLLIPGLGQTGEMWDPLVPLLAENYSVIQFDPRGIGRSLEKRSAFKIDDYTSDCLELLDRLQVDQALVAGISFGGVLAQRFAADHPSRVSKLVLMSTTDRTSPYLRQMAKLLVHALRRFPLRVFLQTVELLGSSPEEFDAHEKEILQSVAERPISMRSRRTLGNQLRCLVSVDKAARGEKFTGPTLVLAGEYDALIPNVYGRKLAADLADAKFMILQGCGHNPVTEQPKVVAKVMLDFFQKSSTAKAELTSAVN
jgi:pimeloyl-ACP methyl ester carboxylesterase